MSAEQTEICGRCGQMAPPPSIQEEVTAYEPKQDTTLCQACGQPRPYPTGPGPWEYRTGTDDVWLPVTVVQQPNGQLKVVYDSETVRLEDFGDPYGQWRKQTTS
jgi:hypothetical protein